jgi:hypothetical protein
MAKFKVTRKDIIDRYSTIFSAGYCDLQNIIQQPRIIGCNAGIYGWNYDVIEHPTNSNICIVTGYRPFGKPIEWNFIKKFNKKVEEAQQLYYDKKTISYEELVRKLNRIEKLFWRELEKVK